MAQKCPIDMLKAFDLMGGTAGGFSAMVWWLAHEAIRCRPPPIKTAALAAASQLPQLSNWLSLVSRDQLEQLHCEFGWSVAPISAESSSTLISPPRFEGFAVPIISLKSHTIVVSRPLEDMPQPFDGMGGAAGGVFDGKPIVREGIASTPPSITGLKAPKSTIAIAHLPHQIIL
jgi:hypothetical protein